MQAIADPPAYQRARAAVRFDEISRALVHALKYGDRLDLAPMMGRWLGQAGGELLVDADALVPCRCIGGGDGLAASTNRRYSRPQYLKRADCRLPLMHSSA